MLRFGVKGASRQASAWKYVCLLSSEKWWALHSRKMADSQSPLVFLDSLENLLGVRCFRSNTKQFGKMPQR